MFKDDQGDGLYEDIIKRILFFCCLLLTVFIVFLTATAIYLGGTSFLILGLGGIITTISLSLICWTPYKLKIYSIPLFLGLIPLYMILPGKGTYHPDAPLEYRSVFASSSQWFSGLPEKDLIRMGENWGYSKIEKQSLSEKGTLADQYDKINRTNLFQYDSSVVLDSWFFDRGHYWFLKSRQQNASLLIFLHGSGGNFKAYSYWFSQKAANHNISMAFPTWGFGTWSPEKLGKRVKKVIEDIKKDNSIDPDRIFICGLSQGGLTGFKIFAAEDIDVAGFISISGTPLLLDRELKSLSKTPIYILHGEKDERISISSVRRTVSMFENTGNSITCEEFPNADHTLIKVRTDEITDKIFNWILSH